MSITPSSSSSSFSSLDPQSLKISATIPNPSYHEAVPVDNAMDVAAYFDIMALEKGRKDPEDLSKYSVEELIELALQLDCGMYARDLHPIWQNPGIAGLCAFRLIADALKKSAGLQEDVPVFLKEIEKVTQECLKSISEKGALADLKPKINGLFEYNYGFKRQVYSAKEAAPFLQAVTKLSHEGQLCFRPSDGRFFLIVDQGFIEESLKLVEGLAKPKAAIGHAHTVLNEGMSRLDGEEIWYSLVKQFAETTAPDEKLKAGQSGIRYLNKKLSFEVIGVYSGAPKTNSRLKRTFHLRVDIKERLDARLQSQLKDYWDHITFGEEARQMSSLEIARGSLDGLLMEGSALSQELAKILFEAVFEKAMKHYEKRAKELQEQGYHDEALTFYQKTLQESKLLSAFPQLRLAKSLYLNNQTHKALQEVSAVVNLCEAHATLTKIRSRAYRWLGIIQFREGNFIEAEKALLSSLKHYAEQGDSGLLGRAKAIRHIGNIFFERGRYSEGHKLQLMALERISQVSNVLKKNRNKVLLLLDLGKNLVQQERFERAIAHFIEARDILNSLQQPPERFVARLYVNLGNAYLQIGKSNKAIETLEAAIKIQRQRGGSSNLLAACLTNLAKAYSRSGIFKRAIECHQEAQKIDFKGKETRYTACNYRYIGETYLQQGDYEKALANLIRGHEILMGHEEWKIHADRYDMQYSLILAYKEAGIASKDNAHLNHAVELAKGLHQWDQEVVDKTKNLSSFDLIGYTNTLELWVTLLNLTGKRDEAYAVLSKEAEFWKEKLPSFSWQWIRKGIELLEHGKEDRKRLSQFYALEGEVACLQKRFVWGLCCFDKALKLFANEEIKLKREACQIQLAIMGKNIDADLLMHLERARETAGDLEALYFADLRQDKALSEHAKNETAAFFVTLRNLLDIGYSRLVRQGIHSPNQTPREEIYFPIEGSKMALRNRLYNEGILNTSFKQAHFNFEKGFGDITALLKSSGLIDEKNTFIKLEKFDFLHFPEFTLYEDRLKRLINSVKLGEKCTQKMWEDTELRLEDVLTELESRGYITDKKITQKAKSDPEFSELSREFCLQRPFLKKLFLKKQVGDNFVKVDLISTELQRQFTGKTKYSGKKVSEELLEVLQKGGYLDGEGKIIKVLDDGKISPYAPFLMKLMQELGVGQFLTAKGLQEIDIDAFVRRARPSPELILERLKENGVLLQEDGSDHIILSPKWDLSQPLRLSRDKDSHEVMCGLEAMEPHILAQIKEQAGRCSLDDEFKEVYDAIICEQDFSYVKDERMTEAWIGKLSCIQNDTKHIRLTPQGVAAHTEMREASIAKKQVKIFIEYLETQFYAWSFVGILRETDPSLSERNAIDISRDILNFFKEKGYVNNKIVCHSKAIEIAEMIKKATKGTEKLREDFRQLLLIDLSSKNPSWGSFSAVLADELVRKAMQQMHIKLEADSMVDVRWLISTALDHVENLLMFFGRSMPLSFPFELSWVSEKDFLPKLPKTSLGDLAKKYLEVDKRSEVFVQNAKDASTPRWLALHYFEKAFSFSQNREELFSIALEAADFTEKCQLKTSQLRWLNRAYQACFKYDQREQITNKIQECHQFDSKIDRDLFSEWMHCNEVYQLLSYEIFEIYVQGFDPHRLHRTQSRAIDVIIKLRHLLDHALGRFSKNVLYSDRSICIWDAKFPCAASLEGLKEALVENIKKHNEDAPKEFQENVYTIDNHPFWHPADAPKFQRAFNSIKDTQPFSSGRWLHDLKEISNQAKHAGLKVPDAKSFNERRESAVTIQNFFPPLIPDALSLLELLELSLSEVWKVISALQTEI